MSLTLWRKSITVAELLFCPWQVNFPAFVLLCFCICHPPAQHLIQHSRNLLPSSSNSFHDPDRRPSSLQSHPLCYQNRLRPRDFLKLIKLYQHMWVCLVSSWKEDFNSSSFTDKDFCFYNYMAEKLQTDWGSHEYLWAVNILHAIHNSLENQRGVEQLKQLKSKTFWTFDAILKYFYTLWLLHDFVLLMQGFFSTTQYQCQKYLLKISDSESAESALFCHFKQHFFLW